MRKIMLAVFLLTLHMLGYAQSTPKKIKVLLLGTFHFHHSLDSNSKRHVAIFSQKRQEEINEIVSKLVKFHPDKIFLEFSAKQQPSWDSIYRDYLLGKEPAVSQKRANEIFQLGMRTAKVLGHPKVYGMNYQPMELKDPLYKPVNNVDSNMQRLYLALDEYGDTARTNKAFFSLPYPYRHPNQDSLLQTGSILAFLRYLNSSEKQRRDDYINWNYVYGIGKDGDMTMTDYVGTFWYGTNLRNYNNVLRNVDYKKDSAYVIIYGASHIAFLKHLFSMNPFFEVVEMDEVFQ